MGGENGGRRGSTNESTSWALNNKRESPIRRTGGGPSRRGWGQSLCEGPDLRPDLDKGPGTTEVSKDTVWWALGMEGVRAKR